MLNQVPNPEAPPPTALVESALALLSGGKHPPNFATSPARQDNYCQTLTLGELATVFDAIWMASEGLWRAQATATVAAAYFIEIEADRLAGISEDIAAIAMAAEPKTDDDTKNRFHIIARFATMVRNREVNEALAVALSDLPPEV